MTEKQPEPNDEKPLPSKPPSAKPRSEHDIEDDIVDEASRESFPASDPPAY